MIGNDIVDLVLAKKDSNWERCGFLDKIFTTSEKKMIRDSRTPFETVWLLWSMKESAYKIYNRNTGIRLFNPLQFECAEIISTGSNYLGRINFHDQFFYTSSIISGDCVATVATNSPENIGHIKEVEDGISIIKVDSLPFIWDGTDVIPVSVSHHGRFTKVVLLDT